MPTRVFSTAEPIIRRVRADCSPERTIPFAECIVERIVGHHIIAVVPGVVAPDARRCASPELVPLTWLSCIYNKKDCELLNLKNCTRVVGSMTKTQN